MPLFYVENLKITELLSTLLIDNATPLYWLNENEIGKENASKV